jgi:hypothetical protein
MVINFSNKSITYYFLIIVLAVLISSCESDHHRFYVPKTPFKSGFEELGNPNQGNLKYNFELFKYEYVINLSINKDKFIKTTLLTKTVLVNEGEKLSSNKFYNIFLHDKNDVPILKSIIKQINKRSIGKEFDLVQILVNYVQSIPYEEAKAQKYPIETLFLNKGDCSDKSILLAKLLSIAGYKTCLFEFNNAKHMAVGIATDDKSLAYRSGYIYLESTGYSPIGQIPKEFVGGIKINEDPILIQIKEGSSPVGNYKELLEMYKDVEIKYGTNYFNTNKSGKIILEKIKNIDSKLTSIKNSLTKKENEIKQLHQKLVNNDCSSELDADKYELCNSIQNSVNQKNNEYNVLVNQFNNLNNDRNRDVSIINEINRSNYIKN